MPKKVYTDDELIQIALKIREMLKGYGMTIRQLKRTLNHALESIEYIRFGEAPEVPDEDPGQTSS